MSWKSWLDECVAWDNDTYMQRRMAINRLCKYGLIPFIEAHGYSLATDYIELGSRIATGLYNNRGKSTLESNWSFGISNILTERSDDYRSHFDHVLCGEEWEYFWRLWALWCDVDTNSSRGWDRQQDIQEYIWSQVCIESSPQTQIINELLGVEEEEVSVRQRPWGAAEHEKDVYLKDAMESNEWGGIRR